MENENSQHLRDPYLFLKDAQAKNIFGKVDFELKSGTHIQYRHPEQEEQFLFISKYYPELNLYYQNFFHITLEHGGENTDTYYYLDFEGNKRGEIPPEQRYFLSEEHLIIGIFICKAYNIDFNSEESSLTTFKKLMREEYEEYKEDFYRLLAHTKNSIYTGDDDIELEKSIQSAFREFRKLGWVYFKNETQFVIMPSMERLRKLYSEEINNTPNLVKQYQFNAKQ